MMVKRATEYFKLTEAELDDLIEKRKSEGWIVSGNIMMIPPDDRINWCAEWILYKGICLPHWIIRDKE